MAESSRHRDKQLRQAVMVDHKVRHLEQSFVALKICVRLEVAFNTQFARALLLPPRQTQGIIGLVASR